ncbi:MFS transporter [Neomicrococcus lactis]
MWSRSLNFERYKEVLAIPGVPLLLFVGLIARFPHAAAGVMLTLHVAQTLGMDWASAGLAGAIFTIGIAIGSPWRGRSIDMKGLRKALIPSIISEVTVWSIAPHVSFQWLLLLVFVGGVFALPVFSVMRQALSIMARGHKRRSAYALDAIVTEIVFMTGPGVAALVATMISSVVGLTAIGIASSLAGVVLMIANPPMRSVDGTFPEDDTADQGAFNEVTASTTMGGAATASADVSDEVAAVTGTIPVQRPLSPRQRRLQKMRHRVRRQVGSKVTSQFGWVTPAVLGLLVISAAAGLLFAGSDVDIVAVSGAANQSSQLWIVFLFWSGASLIGGLIYGAQSRRINPVWLLLAMAAFTIPALMADNVWQLGLLLILPGLVCAPLLSSASEKLADIVDEERRGEAMGWYGSAMTAGSALGAPGAGIFIDTLGPGHGFMAVGVAGVILALVAIFAGKARRRRLAS